MGIELIPADIRDHYEIHEWRHAIALLHTEFNDEFQEIMEVLRTFRLKREYISVPGGRKSKVSEFIDGALYAKGWKEKSFDTRVKIDDIEYESPTHSVNCFKNRIALEIEWNNKDPFFDRDLSNFRLLFDLRVVSVGVIITRCDELQKLFKKLGRGPSYGASTTHMSKLLFRIEGGSGGGCPILVFGIRPSLFSEE